MEQTLFVLSFRLCDYFQGCLINREAMFIQVLVSSSAFVPARICRK